MPIDQVRLSELNVKDRLINRLLAVFTHNVPEPPMEMLDFKESGEYHAINEFYAMKLLVAKSKRPSIREVRALIGGRTTTVNSNMKTLRTELGPETFELPSSNDSDDDLAMFKKKLIQKERALLDIELEEQEKYYIAEAIKQEEAHDKSTQSMVAKLNQAIGQNGSLQAINDRLKTDNDGLLVKLRKEAVNEVELKNAQLLAGERTTALKEKQESLDKLFGTFDTLKSAAADRAGELNREIKRLNSQDQRNQQKTRDLENQINTHKQAAEDAAEELGQYRTKAFELSNQLSQSQLEFDHEKSINELVGEVKVMLAPVKQLKEVTERQDQTTKKLASLNITLKELATEILNVNNLIKMKKNHE